MSGDCLTGDIQGSAAWQGRAFSAYIDTYGISSRAKQQ